MDNALAIGKPRFEERIYELGLVVFELGLVAFKLCVLFVLFV